MPLKSHLLSDYQFLDCQGPHYYLYMQPLHPIIYNYLANYNQKMCAFRGKRMHTSFNI